MHGMIKYILCTSMESAIYYQTEGKKYFDRKGLVLFY